MTLFQQHRQGILHQRDLSGLSGSFFLGIGQQGLAKSGRSSNNNLGEERQSQIIRVSDLLSLAVIRILPSYSISSASRVGNPQATAYQVEKDALASLHHNLAITKQRDHLLNQSVALELPKLLRHLLHLSLEEFEHVLIQFASKSPLTDFIYIAVPAVITQSRDNLCDS